jgi:cytochrome c556
MTLRHAVRFALPAFAVVAFGLASVASRAADDEPTVTIKEVMNACNHPKWGLFGLIKVTLKQPDVSAEDWKVISYRAAMMSEAGQVLAQLVPPRGAEDAAGLAKWKAQCAAYRDAAKALRSAANTKNRADTDAAVKAIAERCEACHEAHQNE